MPVRVVVAVLAERVAGVIAFVALVPAIVSALVARVTPPTCVVEEGVKEMRPPVTSIPLPTTTAPNCVLEAAAREMLTEGPLPPPTSPDPTVMLLIVPVFGGSAESVPSGAISKLDPILTPPRETLVAGTRPIVPETVMVPPESPVPAVIEVTVPPNAEALLITPNWFTLNPEPSIKFPC